MTIYRKRSRGFTLIEILMAIFAFSLLVAIVSGVYVAFTKSQSRARVTQLLLSDSQYALELMAREAHNNRIFDFNPSGSGQKCDNLLGGGIGRITNCLLLIREDESLVAFAYVEALIGTPDNIDPGTLIFIVPNCNSDYSVCSWGVNAGQGTYTELLSPDLNDVKVSTNGLQFKIEPTTDPYEDETNNIQPRVSIKLKTEFLGTKDVEAVKSVLQTTVSSRIYGR